VNTSLLWDASSLGWGTQPRKTDPNSFTKYVSRSSCERKQRYQALWCIREQKNCSSNRRAWGVRNYTVFSGSSRSSRSSRSSQWGWGFPSLPSPTYIFSVIIFFHVFNIFDVFDIFSCFSRFWCFSCVWYFSRFSMFFHFFNISTHLWLFHIFCVMVIFFIFSRNDDMFMLLINFIFQR